MSLSYDIQTDFDRSLLFALSLFAVAAVLADDVEDENAAFVKGDYPTALKLLMPMAQQGNVVAELDIGLMYFSGNGLPQDRREGARWFLASA